MNHQPESIEALRLKCILLETKVQLLEYELEKSKESISSLKKAREYFWEWIKDSKNYKFWKLNSTNQAAA